MRGKRSVTGYMAMVHRMQWRLPACAYCLEYQRIIYYSEREKRHMENKKEIVARLKLLLMVTRAGAYIEKMTLSDDEKKCTSRLTMDVVGKST